MFTPTRLHSNNLLSKRQIDLVSYNDMVAFATRPIVHNVRTCNILPIAYCLEPIEYLYMKLCIKETSLIIIITWYHTWCQTWCNTRYAVGQFQPFIYSWILRVRKSI